MTEVPLTPEKLFSFRWDIDHRACITDGLPRIMQVCDEFGVKNTFFVNMGRSTNLREWLSKGGIKGSKAKLDDMEAALNRFADASTRARTNSQD